MPHYNGMVIENLTPMQALAKGYFLPNWAADSQAWINENPGKRKNDTIVFVDCKYRGVAKKNTDLYKIIDKLKLDKMKKVKISFEDNGQDVSYFVVEFDQFFNLGRVVESDFQQSIWTKQFVLSGKPHKGQFIVISEAPGQPSMTFKHKVMEIESLG